VSKIVDSFAAEPDFDPLVYCDFVPFPWKSFNSNLTVPVFQVSDSVHIRNLDGHVGLQTFICELQSL
jgi:hypothetical protein